MLVFLGSVLVFPLCAAMSHRPGATPNSPLRNAAPRYPHPCINNCYRLGQVSDSNFIGHVIRERTVPVLILWATDPHTFNGYARPDPVSEDFDKRLHAAELHACGSVRVYTADPSSCTRFRSWIRQQGGSANPPACQLFVYGRLRGQLDGLFTSEALWQFVAHEMRKAKECESQRNVRMAGTRLPATAGAAARFDARTHEFQRYVCLRAPEMSREAARWFRYSAPAQSVRRANEHSCVTGMSHEAEQA